VPVSVGSSPHCYVCRVDLINDLRAIHDHVRPPPLSSFPETELCVPLDFNRFWLRALIRRSPFLSTTAGNCDKLIELNGTNISHQIACDNKRAWPSEWTENVDGWAGSWVGMGEHGYPGDSCANSIQAGTATHALRARHVLYVSLKSLCQTITKTLRQA